MKKMLPFSEALEAADKSSPEDQEAQLEILHRRVIERRRKELAKDIEQAQREFQAGQCQPRTSEELMNEIISRDVRCSGQVLLCGRHAAL